MADIVRVAPNGVTIALTTSWLRITQNPTCSDRYPTVGKIVMLKGHKLMSDGKYLITMVEEFEPPYFEDEDGRDIRISVYPRENGIGRGLNGANFIRAMENE